MKLRPIPAPAPAPATIAPAPAQGFALIGAIVLVVVLAALATAIVRLNTTQQATSAQDIVSARGQQAARAAIEWGLYRIRTGSGTCPATTTLTSMFATTGFNVTVSCTSNDYREGQTAPGVAITKRFYRIDAVACNAGTSCPANSQVGRADYVERRRVATSCAIAATSPIQDC